jgi:hypothetical protein
MLIDSRLKYGCMERSPISKTNCHNYSPRVVQNRQALVDSVYYYSELNVVRKKQV